MKPYKLLISAVLAASLIVVIASSFKGKKIQRSVEQTGTNAESKGCVFLTVFGEESSAAQAVYKTPERVLASTEKGLQWIAKAQLANGGWGAGSHSRQNVMDPHAVNADPATTSMVAMALLRSGSTVKSGAYSSQLKQALDYLMETVEASSKNSAKITSETGTQIQTKLGSNIDAALTLR